MGNDSFEASMASGANDKFTRREFARCAAAFTASAIAGGGSILAVKKNNAPQAVTPSSDRQVPHRPLGKTGAQVSALGVGGYPLGSTQDQQEANELVGRALDAGINFFDNAREY